LAIVTDGFDNSNILSANKPRSAQKRVHMNHPWSRALIEEADIPSNHKSNAALSNPARRAASITKRIAGLYWSPFISE
jgi:hypothetical protein